jgi:hypothetical protein
VVLPPCADLLFLVVGDLEDVAEAASASDDGFASFLWLGGAGEGADDVCVVWDLGCADGRYPGTATWKAG